MNKLEELYKLKVKAKWMNEEITKLRKEILVEMNEKKIKCYPVGNFVANILDKVRTSIDKEKVKKLLTDEQLISVSKETGYQELKVTISDGV